MTSAVIIGMLTTLLAGGMIVMPQGGLTDPGPSFPTENDIEAVKTFLDSRADVASFEIETESETGNDGIAEREFEVKVETTSGEEKVLKFEREVEDNGQIELKVVSENDGQRTELDSDDDNDGNRGSGDDENSGRGGNDNESDDSNSNSGSNSGPGRGEDEAVEIGNSGRGNADDPREDREDLRDEDGRDGKVENEIEIESEDGNSGRN